MQNERLMSRETLEGLLEKQSEMWRRSEQIAHGISVEFSLTFDQIVENVYRDLHIEDSSVERDRVETALRERSNPLSS